jgi:hypothetical protein
MSQPPPWDPGRSSNQGQPPSWPSGDQPPSWPSAGADQGQPPPWPPGDQPPYPGPGYTYGYGPQPPRSRRRYRFRGVRALITLGLFIAFGIVVRSITASHDSVSTGSPQDEDANDDAVLMGGNGRHYQADFDTIAGYTNFDSGTIRVGQGDTVTGAVTFQMPDGVKISQVRWSTLSGFGSTVEWNVPG